MFIVDVQRVDCNCYEPSLREKKTIFLHFTVDLHRTKSVGKKFLGWNTDVGRYLFNLDIQRVIVIIMNQDYEKKGKVSALHLDLHRTKSLGEKF